MNHVSQTVAENIKKLRENEDLTRADFIDRINRRNPSSPWTASKLGNVEHAKGEDRAISIDELTDICQSFEVTLFDLTIPNPEPGWSRHIQYALYGFDFEGDEWRTQILRRANLTYRLRWHPEVVDHVMPFWAESEYVSTMADSFWDDEDFDRNWATRINREAMADLIESERRMVKQKETDWKREGNPPPDDKMLDAWVESALKKRDVALERIHKKYSKPVDGSMLIEVVPPGDEGDS